MDLGALTWTQLDEPIVVVPVGSCEQHGPHLPLHTDTVIAVAIAEALAARRDDCVVAPPIAVTASGEHQGFPGTLSIGTDVMADLVVQLVRSADWASGVVVVNGHGGNVVAMERAGTVLRGEGRDVCIWWPRWRDADPHAGHTETSLMLALAPGEVHLDRRVAGPVPTTAELMRRGVRAVSPSGVLGDPMRAEADHGRHLFEELVDQLAAAVGAWAP